MADPSTLALLGRLLPALGLLIGALLLVRRWAQRGGGPSRSTVRVVTRTPLARGALVAVVEYDGRRYLVGAAERGVQLLSELGAAEGAAEPAAQDAAAAPAGQRPRTGLLEQLRGMTVRTHVERPSVVPRRT